MTERPLIAVTMGDAAGVGPEVIVKALAAEKIHGLCRPLVVGSGAVLSGVISMLKNPLKLRPVRRADEAGGTPGTIDIIDLHNLAAADVTIGRGGPGRGEGAP